jgi:hypothetical protein
MTRKPKPDDPDQFKRFMETVRQVGEDADPETFDRVLEEVARSSRPKPTPKPRHGEDTQGKADLVADDASDEDTNHETIDQGDTESRGVRGGRLDRLALNIGHQRQPQFQLLCTLE